MRCAIRGRCLFLRNWMTRSSSLVNEAEIADEDGLLGADGLRTDMKEAGNRIEVIEGFFLGRHLRSFLIK